MVHKYTKESSASVTYLKDAGDMQVMKILLKCVLNWWQGMLGRTQRFQYTGMIACHLGVLLLPHDEALQKARTYNYASSYL